MATIKITVKQLKKLIAEQVEYENFVETNIKELNEQVKFLSSIKEDLVRQSPEDLLGRSSTFGDGNFDRGQGDPSGSYGKKLALVIAKSPLLRKQVESIPGFSFKEFVSWANNTGTIELFGGNDRTEKDITDLNSADYKDHVVGVSAALKNYKQAKEQHAAKQA